MEYNELYHFGTKGMRWGFRRYQNEDGSLTDEGRRHYGYGIKRKISEFKEARAKKKLAKKRAKALEAARKAKAEKKAHEEAKKKAMETGSAAEVLKFKNELTVEEKNRIASRLRADDELGKYAQNDANRRAEEAARNSKWNKFKRFTSKLGDLSESIDKAGKFYNSGAKVINAFTDYDLPLIGDKKNKEKFGESKKLAKDLLERSGDMPVDDILYEIKRIQAVQAVEKYAAGEGGGTGGTIGYNDPYKKAAEEAKKAAEAAKKEEAAKKQNSSPAPKQEVKEQEKFVYDFSSPYSYRIVPAESNNKKRNKKLRKAK